MKNTLNKKDFKYDLTIGMIFRDDIKYIRKCLETMMPLREALNCQLIMTDTGSVDGSRDVAEEFADILLDFEWCDDFAAARNTGTSIAEGRWFAYFDCDQEFDESILEIAKFLKSPDSNVQESASVGIKNYKKFGDYQTFDVTRSSLVHNFQNGIRPFESLVHESIPRSRTPMELPVFIHHWGHTDAVHADKINRNKPLIYKMIQEQPSNLKNWMQYVSETGDQNDKLLRIQQALTHIPENPDLYQLVMRLFFYTFMYKVGVATDNKETMADGEQGYNDTITLVPENTLLELDFIQARLAYNLKKCKRDVVYQQFLDFKRVYEYNEKHGDPLTSTIFVAYANKISVYYHMEVHTASCCLKSMDPSIKALGAELLSKSKAYQYNPQDQDYPELKHFIALINTAENAQLFADVYDFLREKELYLELKRYKEHINKSLLRANKEYRANILEAMSENVVDDFTAMMSLRNANFEEKAFTNKVFGYITKEDDFYLKPYNAHLLFGYLLTGKDPLGYVEKNEISFCVRYFNSLLESYPECVELVEATYSNPDFTIQSLKEEKLWCYLGMRVALHLSDVEEEEKEEEDDFEDLPEITAEFPDETTPTEEIEQTETEPKTETADVQRINKIYSQAVPMMYNYANKVYNPYLLSEEGRGVLPPEELFSIYAMKALQAAKPLDMIQSLKEAMAVCPAYGPIIKVFLSQVEAPEKVKQVVPEEKPEMSDLSKQIKGTIKTLLSSGDKVQAKTFLDKYTAINPNDPEIPDLLKQLED